jgi:hypothetical protein
MQEALEMIGRDCTALSAGRSRGPRSGKQYRIVLKHVQVQAQVQVPVPLQVQEREQAELSIRMRYLGQAKREEEHGITGEEVEEMIVLDLREDVEWVEDLQAMDGVPSISERCAKQARGGRKGARWKAKGPGMPRSTIHRWSRRYVESLVGPMVRPTKGERGKFSRDNCEMLRVNLVSHPGMTHKEVNSAPPSSALPQQQCCYTQPSTHPTRMQIQ